MKPAPNKNWRAVRVVSGDDACAAALQLRGRRFLTREAPRLPLPDCNLQNECACKYQHLPDRRGSPRREADSGFAGPPKSLAAERRRPGERRERRR